MNLSDQTSYKLTRQALTSSKTNSCYTLRNKSLNESGCFPSNEFKYWTDKHAKPGVTKPKLWLDHEAEWLFTCQVDLKKPHSFHFFTLTWGGRTSIQCRFPLKPVWWVISTFIQWLIPESTPSNRQQNALCGIYKELIKPHPRYISTKEVNESHSSKQISSCLEQRLLITAHIQNHNPCNEWQNIRHEPCHAKTGLNPVMANAPQMGHMILTYATYKPHTVRKKCYNSVNPPQ